MTRQGEEDGLSLMYGRRDDDRSSIRQQAQGAKPPLSRRRSGSIKLTPAAGNKENVFMDLIRYRREEGIEAVSRHFQGVETHLGSSIYPEEDIKDACNVLHDNDILSLRELTDANDALQDIDQNQARHIANIIWSWYTGGWDIRNEFSQVRADNIREASGRDGPSRKHDVSQSITDSDDLSDHDKKRKRDRSRSRRLSKRDEARAIKRLGRSFRGEELSDEDDEDAQGNISKVQDLLKKNSLSLIKTDYLPEASHIVKLSESAKKARKHPVSNRRMHVSSHPLDDKRWIPSYVGSGLSLVEKKKAIKSREESDKESVGRLIQQFLSYTMAYVATGIITPEAALQATAIVVEMANTHGRETAYQYARRLPEMLRHDILSNKEVDVSEFMATKQDSIEKKSEKEAEKKYQAKEKDKKPKGKGGGKAACHHHPQPPMKGSVYRLSPGENNRPPPISNPNIDRRQDQRHVCLYHDPRVNAVCKDKTCQREHIDTTKPQGAQRFDKIKSIADRNKKKKNGPDGPS